MKYTAVVLKLDEPTKESHLVYPKEEVERAVERFNDGKEKFGVVRDEHTNFIDLYSRGIPVDQLSHKITDVKVDGNHLIATMESLDTPAGRLLEQLVNGQQPPRFAIRGVGTVGKLEPNTVSEFELFSIDAVDGDDVADPI